MRQVADASGLLERDGELVQIGRILERACSRVAALVGVEGPRGAGVLVLVGVVGWVAWQREPKGGASSYIVGPGVVAAVCIGLRSAGGSATAWFSISTNTRARKPT
jgi:hypothetical protein